MFRVRVLTPGPAALGVEMLCRFNWCRLDFQEPHGVLLVDFRQALLASPAPLSLSPLLRQCR